MPDKYPRGGCARLELTEPKREWAKGANPCAHDNFLKIYLKFARVLRRLFLSVVSVTRVVLHSRERDMFRRQTFEVWQPL